MPDVQPAVAPHLVVRLQHRLSALQLDVELQLTRPWTILFGPSGSGKTTILRAIAGLLNPDIASIIASGPAASATLADTDAKIALPAYRRGTPLASQRPALFPHLTVLQNIRYGTLDGYPRAAGTASPPDIPTLAAAFRIDGLLEKFPAQLSGGEAQRVSLARAAMATHARILLLDEPFTGLDLPLRDALITNLLAWQQQTGTPILSVTHDIAEAFQLDAEVIKLADGRVVEQGPVAAVLAEERAQLMRQLTSSAETPA